MPTKSGKSTPEERAAAKAALRVANQTAFRERKEAEKQWEREERRKLNRETMDAARALEKVIPPDPPHRGRSVEWSHELFEVICDLVAEGRTIKQACKLLGICERTIRIWILDDRGADPDASPPVPGAHELMRRAVLLQTEAWADHLIEIADEATEDTVQLAKFRCEQRKWLMGKNNARYNERLALVGDPTQPLRSEQTIEMSDALSEIVGALEEAAREKRLLANARIIDVSPEVVGVSPGAESGRDGGQSRVDTKSAPGPADSGGGVGSLAAPDWSRMGQDPNWGRGRRVVRTA